MTNDELIQFIELCYDVSVDILLKEGEHMPLFILPSKSGVFIVHPDFRDDAGKESATKELPVIASIIEAQAIIMVSETWIVVSEDNNLNNVQPRDHPDRVDSLFVHGELPTGEHYVKACELVKEQGVLKSVKPLDLASGASSGRFTDMFNMDVRARSDSEKEELIHHLRNTYEAKHFGAFYTKHGVTLH
ncbi:MAG: hypothetical protein QM500_04960 [Methylococcales bacterium]